MSLGTPLSEAFEGLESLAIAMGSGASSRKTCPAALSGPAVVNRHSLKACEATDPELFDDESGELDYEPPSGAPRYASQLSRASSGIQKRRRCSMVPDDVLEQVQSDSDSEAE